MGDAVDDAVRDPETPSAYVAVRFPSPHVIFRMVFDPFLPDDQRRGGEAAYEDMRGQAHKMGASA